MTNGFSLRTKPARPIKASLYDTINILILFLHIKTYFMVCDQFLFARSSAGLMDTFNQSFGSIRSWADSIGIAHVFVVFSNPKTSVFDSKRSG
jgi:hypothetical protein